VTKIIALGAKSQFKQRNTCQEPNGLLRWETRPDCVGLMKLKVAGFAVAERADDEIELELEEAEDDADDDEAEDCAEEVEIGDEDKFAEEEELRDDDDEDGEEDGDGGDEDAG